MIPPDFHFLRPLWLLALVPALVLAAAAFRAIRAGHEDWRGEVDPHLLRHLSVKDPAGAGRRPLALLAAGWILASLAMAGPTWTKLPAPALDRLDPTVVALSLGRTMDAEDPAPSRLIVARRKLDDLLVRLRGGQVGLIVYADVPFVAAPLTEDGRIIAQMLPELATDLMPVTANRPDLALAKAVTLLMGANAREGRIVLVTDGVGDDAEKAFASARAAAAAGFPVHVIGVGTDARPDGNGGVPAAAGSDAARLAQLAAAGGGVFTPVAVDSRDLDAVLARLPGSIRNPLQERAMGADEWVDMGPYLVLLLVVLAPLAFRRGLIAGLLLLALLRPDASAHAQGAPLPADPGWSHLWRRLDQQGADAFAAGDYAAAADRFRNPHWRASALYRAGRYEEAAAAYAGVPGTDYDRGNALARAGKLEAAVAAYDAALKADSADADALFNRDLVQQLLMRQNDGQQNRSGGKQGNDGGQADGQQGRGSGSRQDDRKTGENAQKPQDKAKDAEIDLKPDGARADDPGARNPAHQPPDSGRSPPPERDGAPPSPRQADRPPSPPRPSQRDEPRPTGQQVQRPMTEQDQAREQALRMVPDDPSGLLRARIRAYYGGSGKVGNDDDAN